MEPLKEKIEWCIVLRGMKNLLLLTSLVYRKGCQIKNLLYNFKILKPKTPPLTTISVGNVSFGGSEKTPLAMRLISTLLSHGFKPALITRGYKGKWEKSGGILSDGRNIFGSWKDSGDEPFMVAQNIPQAGIFVGKNRLSSCDKAYQMGFDVAILDDGFQHRRLHRDLDIVTYDPAETTALREPVSSLKRAHILLVKKNAATRIKKKINARFPQASFFEYSVSRKGYFRLGEEKSTPSATFKGKKVIAFSGIARPERFSSLLEAESIKPILFLKFPDHYPYPVSSFEKIVEEFQKLKAGAIITTEKDAVKIADYKGFKNIPVYYLKIDVEIDGDFDKMMYSFLKKKEKFL